MLTSASIENRAPSVTYTDQSAFARDAFTTGTQKVRSSATNFVNAAGVNGGDRSNPCGPSFCFVSALANILINSALSLPTISGEVPAGATKPAHASTS